MQFVTDFTGLTVHPVINGMVTPSRNLPNNFNTFMSPPQNAMNNSNSKIPTVTTPIHTTQPTPTSQANMSQTPTTKKLVKCQCSLCHTIGHNKASCTNAPCNGNCNEKSCDARKKKHNEAKNKATLQGNFTNAKWHNILDQTSSRGISNTDALTSIVEIIQKESLQHSNNGNKRKHHSITEDTSTSHQDFNSSQPFDPEEMSQRSTMLAPNKTTPASPVTVLSTSSKGKSCYSVSDGFDYGLNSFMFDSNHTSSSNDSTDEQLSELRVKLRILEERFDEQQNTLKTLVNVLCKTSEVVCSQTKKLKLN